MKKIYWLLSFFCLSAFGFASPRLPRIFGDNMVLQRNQPIPVWGWADPGEKIVIQFSKQVQTLKTGVDGRWQTRLNPEPAGGPYTLTISGHARISFANVLVGEVWVCSGQSNMEMPIAGWGKINHYQQEIEAADYPEIRQFKVPNTVSQVPVDDVTGGEWKICSPETAGDFTATGYFFARELYRQLHVPIGLLNTSWGGTMIETWISRESLEGSAEFKSVMTSIASTDPAAVAKQKTDKLQKTIEALQGVSTPDENTESWKNPELDDSRWPRMKLPGLWEQQGMGLEELDGIVWFRKTFLVGEEDAGKPALLELGKIDDSDDSYVNGTRVGGLKNQYNELRIYHIAAGILKPGKNILAVRVEDTGGGGGIYGEPGSMQLSIGDRPISLTGQWAFRVASVMATNSSGPNSAPTLLYNGMIHPLIPFAIKGVIWYQGEANTGRAYQYRKAFPLMIQDWRKQWGEGDFPFYFVQLASFNSSNGDSEHGSGWAELREAQSLTLSLPNTGMAITTDIGDAHDIHPKNKQDVGKRLAAIALNNCYGKTMEFSGPIFESMQTSGNKLILRFTHVGSGLLVKDRYGYIRGFELAGEDRQFHYAKAYLEGNSVVVYQDSIATPVALRYGWTDDAGEANLFNKEGFPASPFRTDQWKGVTEGMRYELSKP
jgi:sialate O-acetylesterase